MNALLKDLQALPKPQPASQPAVQADWQLQDAKNRFSQVVRAAQAGVPQWVTVHGKRAVVVLSGDEYEGLVLVKSSAPPPETQSKPVQSLFERLRGENVGLNLTDAEVDELFTRDRGPWRSSEAHL